MAETVQKVNINLAGLERRIDAVTEAVRRVEYEVNSTNDKLNTVSNNLSQVKAELRELRGSFETFISDNRKATALQKAATELIRVRQELDQNFGSYKVVRETMLGVLQATDLALVKKTTISQVTEELMLSTPDYWLAPCLVAVSAWIGNDRDLADRAIAEAVRRDEEKTALTMALICRRNNRTATCYEWLSIYFARQSAANFTESNFTYLNAYLNGVFGPDEKHMCDDYVAKWMKEIQSNGEDFEAKQTELWRSYCEDFTVDLEGQFPNLSSCVHECGAIEAYVSRINSVEQIAGNFSRMQNVDVDQQKLKKDIDQTLVTLISRYDAKEEPLRKEERYLMAVRYFDGDTAAAKASILEADRKRTEDTIDLVGQMTNVIIKKDGTSPSEKKTAISFLSSYIRSGFDKYITEKQPDFPDTITLEVDGWNGQVSDAANITALKADYAQYMQQCRESELAAVQAKRPKMLKIGAIALAVLGVLFLIGFWPLGLPLLGGAGYCLIRSKKMVKNIVEITADVNEEYDLKLRLGEETIDKALAEWDEALTIVNSFESQKKRNIIA